MQYRDLVVFCEKTFETINEQFENHEIDDWEQVYFDAIEKKLNTDDQEALVHLFYADDDSNTDVAEHLLDDILGRRLIQAYVFEPNSDMTVAVMVVSKKEITK